MSLENARRFFQEIQQDSKFFELLQQTMHKTADFERDQAIVEFARKHGFSFSAQELEYFFNETSLMNSLKSNNFYTAESTLSMNKLEQLFIWLSGVSPKILATCPESEQKKHAALGGAVLIPALLAIVTASFLLYTLNFSKYAIVPVALLWSGMILLMDRALLATYRKGFSFWGKLGQFSLRFTIALLIAVTVAHPVVLLLFSERIDAAYNAGRINTERAQLALQCDLNNPQSELSILDAKVTQQRSQLLNDKPFFEPASCTKDALTASSVETPTLNTLAQQIGILKAKQLQADQDAALYIQNAEKEKEGIVGNGLTGVRGCKKDTQCKKWLNQASERKEDSIQLGKEIAALETRINELNKTIANQLIETQQVLQKQCEAERGDLKTVRMKQHELDQQTLTSLTDQRSLLSQRCGEKDAAITQLKPDVLTQTEILTQLIFTQHGVSWHNLLVFLVFMSLFLAVDMLAVVLKMARIGVYEAKVDLAETQSKLLNFMEQRHQSIAQFAKLADQEQALIEQLKVSQLKSEMELNFKTLIESFTQTDRHSLGNIFKN